jgi:hypothetical protein
MYYRTTDELVDYLIVNYRDEDDDNIAIVLYMVSERVGILGIYDGEDYLVDGLVIIMGRHNSLWKIIDTNEAKMSAYNYIDYLDSIGNIILEHDEEEDDDSDFETELD